MVREKKIKKILDASYENPDEAERSFTKMGYKYDKELSTPESKVFIDKNGKPNIAFRGSKRVIDDFLGSDLKLMLGLEKYDSRFKEAKHITQLVENKYGKDADVYGHSLGGSLAEKSGAKGKVYTANKGVGIFDIGKTIPNNQTDFRNKNDLVSLLSVTQNHKNNNLITKDTGKSSTDIIGNHGINFS